MVIKGQQYKNAILAIGMSQAKASAFFGFSTRQSRRIANGTNDLSEAATKLMVVMLHCGLTPKAVDEIVRVMKIPTAKAKEAA